MGKALSGTTGGAACEVLLWLATVIIVANTVQVFNARWVRLMLFDLHLGLSDLGRRLRSRLDKSDAGVDGLGSAKIRSLYDGKSGPEKLRNHNSVRKSRL